MGYIRAAGMFVLLIHLFACLWLYVGARDGQWMDTLGTDPEDYA